MSDSSTLSRLAIRPGLDARLRDPEDELCETLDCFGWLRGVRERAVMLELRKKSGNILAIGYAWIERIEFDPSAGIVLHLAREHILIRGKNLNAGADGTPRLFEGLTRHRVPWIREANAQAAMSMSETACVVEAISW